MSWKKIYSDRTCSAAEAVQLIQSGDRVVTAHGVAEPPALVDAMVKNAAAYKDVEVCHMLSVGSGSYSKSSLKENFIYNGIFTSTNTRKSIAEGHGQFTPAFFHEVPGYFRKGLIPVDVFMVQVAPPDKDGFCCIGLSSDYTMQGIESAKVVLAQVNDHVPRVFGDCFVHVSKIDRFTQVSAPLIQIPPAHITSDAEKISDYCVEMIEDGSTLQVGIGAIPEAITKNLIHKKDLGVHSELVTDRLIDLYEAGVVTNEKKSLDKGKLVATFLMGTQKLYDFADNNPAVELRPVDYVNNPIIVAQCHKMVSINSCIEVDFMGQVASESIGTRQFSGVGGQVDFVRGTSMAHDEKGMSIIALTSTTTDKEGNMISKIVPYLTHGTAITTSRNDVDRIVTEYGVAYLKGRSLQDRARQLIDIAHPQFRDSFAAEFEKRFNVSF